MAAAQAWCLPFGCQQLVGGMLAHGVEHAVAAVVGLTARHHCHQRFLHQAGQQVDHRSGRQRVASSAALIDITIDVTAAITTATTIDIAAAADGLRRRQRAATGKHRQAPVQHLLGPGQQVVAPVDQQLQRALARRHGGVAGAEQGKAGAKLGGDGPHRQHPHPGGGQFDRQRNAFDPAANLHHRRRVVGIQAEGRLGTGRAVGKQSDGGVLQQLACGGRVSLGSRASGASASRHIGQLGQAQRRHRVRQLTGHPQHFAAGGQQLDARPGLQQRLGQAGRCVQHMLAVVQDQQQLPVSDKLAQRIGHRPARRLFDAQHAGHCLRHPLSGLLQVLQRRQLNKPHAVGKAVHQLTAQRRRQARFADAARAQKRDQPVLRQQAVQLGQHLLAVDEAVQRLGQVVGRGRQRAQRREVRSQRRRQHLPHPLRQGQITQPHGAQVAQRHAGRQPAAQ